MDPMDELYRLYTDEYVADLCQAAQRLNSLYSEPSDIPVRCMSRGKFEEYLTDDRESESKRHFLRRLLKHDQKLVSRLPQSVRRWADRQAA